LKELLVDDTAAELELLLDDFDKVVGVADETFCKDLIKSSRFDHNRFRLKNQKQKMSNLF
jgi:hypothetical protein